MSKIFLDKENKQLDAFFSILDAIPVSVYWKDISGKYLGCNEYMVKMAGPNLTREDIIGKTDEEFVWSEISDELRQIDSSVIKNKVKYEVEETPLIANAEKRTYLSTKSPLFDNATGEVIGLIGVSIDITDRINAEKMKKERDINNKISQALEILSSSIVHEVRTPLAGIKVHADNLDVKINSSASNSMEQKYKAKIVGHIKNIKLGISRANSIVSMLLVKLRSILGYQTESDEYIKDFISINIKDSINEALEEYPFSESEQKLVIWNEDNAEDFKYVGNPIFTKHILFNLIKNSLEAINTIDKGKIQITLKRGDEFNCLIFEDSATGIPAENMKEFFQGFKSSKRNGTGLGLVFCKLTMQSYKGDIVCESEKGKYTRFILSFPAIF